MSTAGKAVFLSALTVVHGARRGVPRAGHGVPVDGARHDPVGRRGRARVAHAPAGAARRARRPRPRPQEHRRTPTSPPRAAGQRWTGVALRRPGAVLAIGLVVLGALIVPALGMHLGMPGAQVVDKGNTSRDGYDMLVAGVRARRRRTRVHHRPRRRRAAPSCRSPPPYPDVVDARVVTAAGGDRSRRRARHRLRPRSTTPAPRRSSTASASELDDAVPARDGRRSRRAEPRPHRRAHRTRALRDRPHPDRRVPAAAHRVPQPRRRAHLDPDEPAHRRRRVRLRDARVPTRLRHRPPRHRAPAVRRRVGAAVLLRAAVRALDGLPAVPARRDPRTLRSHRRHQARDRAKASPAPDGRSPTPRSS